MSLTIAMYTLTGLIAVYSLWFFTSHNSERAIDRMHNLVCTAYVAFLAPSLIIVVWAIGNHTLYINEMPWFWFASANAIIALGASIALLLTRRHRRV